MKYCYVFLLAALTLSPACNPEKAEGEYVCRPCNLACDDLHFSSPGKCPHCGMELHLKSKHELNSENIEVGSGYFFIDGGGKREGQSIAVFYHLPKSFSPSSRILWVIPGSGRNGDSYRDAWIEEAEKYSLLILSPMYPERMYPFEAYHLAGLANDSNLEETVQRIENTNQVKLGEQHVNFSFNPDAKSWLFNDFDRIFDLVVEVLNSDQTSYDIFGHSAGGHVLHRLALFQKKSKARRIIPSNASFYTLSHGEFDFPFGFGNTPFTEDSLAWAFKKELILFLGEQDDESETGGTMLRSVSADQQGFHRLARGNYFFDQAEQTAKKHTLEFNWKRVIVPGVGHDHELMGNAVAEYLYR